MENFQSNSIEENIISSSENINNTNREKELFEQTKSDSNNCLENENEEQENNKSEESNEIKNNDLENSSTIEKENKQISNELEKSDENLPESPSTKSSEVDKDNDSKTKNKEDEYAKYVSYNELGEAIYTDPNTNNKYRWSEEKNDWEQIESTSNEKNKNQTNPYENEYYRWCTETNQWIPKIKTNSNENENEGELSKQSTSNALETEFYKWDKESNQWIPKTLSSNVVYRFENGEHTYTDQDGAVYFWDTEKNAWFPKIDDEFLARYQLNYGFIDNTEDLKSKESTKENESLKKENSELASTNKNDSENALKRKLPQEPKWFDIPPERNTKVYVSNLPTDITEEEFIQVMSKCGLIMKDPKTQKIKVKLYSEPNGQLKGDGLCDYIKVESVDLALNLLDGYDVRGHKIKVQRAKFEMRGEYNPALKPKKKKKEKEKLQKMKERLFDWRPDKLRGERSKHERIVIIKNFFEPELFEKEVHLLIQYQQDLLEECSKCGTVRNVVIFDRHPDGVVQVTMSSPEEADLVVQMMNRRYFGERRLIAEIYDGKTKYKITETDSEAQKRLSKWDEYLEEKTEKS